MLLSDMNIPEEQKNNFPAGISEVEYDNELEMNAFIRGLGYADNIDIEWSEPFWRHGMLVIRIKVGEFA